MGGKVIGTCKRNFLLQAFEQQAEQCNTCISCEQLVDTPGPLSEPWLEEPEFGNEVLESIYKPYDTILEFLESHQEASHHLADYLGLGQMKIVMALQGTPRQVIRIGATPTPIKLGRREQDNPLFGHLSFIKEAEIKKSLKDAQRARLVEQGKYQDKPTYIISEAGKEYLARQRRRNIRKVPV